MQPQVNHLFSLVPCLFIRAKWNKRTSDSQAFGTDGKRALSNGFNEEIPVADHPCCLIHLRKHIEMKLCSIGINGRYQNEFLDNIFGHNAAAILYHGIVDSNDSDDLKQQEII